MNDVIKNIEETRSNKGITKTHVAKKCGHTSAWYQDIVKGRRRLRVDDLFPIAAALGEQPEYFFKKELSVTLNSDKSA